MTISPDTLCLLAVAVLFVLFVLPRLMSMMSGGGAGYPQGNYPQNNGPLNGGGNRPTYDSPDVESQGGIGRDRPRSGGGIFGNVLSRPSGRSSSSGGGGIFNAPPSSHSGGSFGSSSSRHDSPDVESQGGIGRDRN